MKKEYTAGSTARNSQSRSILVMAPNWLGDAVMSLPFFLQLRKSFPEAFICAVCRKYVSGIYSGKNEIDRIIVYGNNGLKSKISLIKEIRSSGPWDTCFLLTPSFSSAFTVYLSGLKSRVGYGTDFRSVILTKSLRGASCKETHLSDSYIRLIGLVSEEDLGYDYLPAVVPPENWKNIIKNKGINGKYAVFSAGASYGPAKLWPAYNYLELAELFSRDRGIEIVTVGTEREREYLDSIAGGDNTGGINLAGRCDIKELVAVLKGAEFVVGNDSGSVHISAALGVPTVSLFGSTSPVWTGPRGKASMIVESNIECSPCFKRKCPIYEYAKCFDDIKVERVYKVICEVMEW